MSSFAHELKVLCHTRSGPYLRPFAPNPEWETAEVFVVGANPATPLRSEFNSFEQYWSGLTLQPELFESKYAAKRKGAPSDTTKRIDQLRRLLAPINCLVTNAAWYPAKKQKLVPRAEWRRGEKHLANLIEHCQPRVLLFHGAKARKFARKYYDVELEPSTLPSRQETVVHGSLLLTYHHFSGNWVLDGRFEPAEDFPVFAVRIREYLAGG